MESPLFTGLRVMGKILPYLKHGGFLMLQEQRDKRSDALKQSGDAHETENRVR
jgi:hypothetical protein